jgi:hypothetical protein
MTQPVIQHFSVPANNDHDVIFTIASGTAGDSLSGCTIYWNAYEQSFGEPVAAIPPVITKTSLSGGGIDILPSPPMTFRVALNKADTASLLRNYYHEATVVDEVNNEDTVTIGIMTVTATENRP